MKSGVFSYLTAAQIIILSFQVSAQAVPITRDFARLWMSPPEGLDPQAMEEITEAQLKGKMRHCRARYLAQEIHRKKLTRIFLGKTVYFPKDQSIGQITKVRSIRVYIQGHPTFDSDVDVEILSQGGAPVEPGTQVRRESIDQIWGLPFLMEAEGSAVFKVGDEVRSISAVDGSEKTGRIERLFETEIVQITWNQEGNPHSFVQARELKQAEQGWMHREKKSLWTRLGQWFGHAQPSTPVSIQRTRLVANQEVVLSADTEMTQTRSPFLEGYLEMIQSKTDQAEPDECETLENEFSEAVHEGLPIDPMSDSTPSECMVVPLVPQSFELPKAVSGETLQPKLKKSNKRIKQRQLIIAE